MRKIRRRLNNAIIGLQIAMVKRLWRVEPINGLTRLRHWITGEV